MSGSGGGGGSYESPLPSCEALVINTHISSPREQVIQSIAVGEILDVEIVMDNGTQVVAVIKDGEIAGGIAAPLLRRLRECILASAKYQAKVLSIEDGFVRIRISAINTG